MNRDISVGGIELNGKIDAINVLQQLAKVSNNGTELNDNIIKLSTQLSEHDEQLINQIKQHLNDQATAFNATNNQLNKAVKSLYILGSVPFALSILGALFVGLAIGLSVAILNSGFSESALRAFNSELEQRENILKAREESIIQAEKLSARFAPFTKLLSKRNISIKSDKMPDGRNIVVLELPESAIATCNKSDKCKYKIANNKAPLLVPIIAD